MLSRWSLFVICILLILLLTVHTPSMSESSELLSNRWLLKKASLYMVYVWSSDALTGYCVYDAAIWKLKQYQIHQYT